MIKSLENNGSKARLKQSLPTLITRDEAEAQMNDMALVINNQRKLAAKRDGEILKLNQGYEAPLAECDLKIEQLTTALRAWAEANPDQFPKDRKSIQMLSGILGFRTGTPKLTLLSRVFNWVRVLALVEEHQPGFIRLKKEVDKEGLLTLHSQATDRAVADAELKRMGLKVTQEESFYIEPNLTELEPRQTQN